MVINQIRATNGSLWISDVGRCTYATYSVESNSIGLSFETSSVMPFVVGDILRSKRWGSSGSYTTSVWDVTTTVSAVNYISASITISAPIENNLYTITQSSNGSWSNFVSMINASGSDWIRVGNVDTSSNRSGSVYITANDLGGPFIDVYDQVTSSYEATAGGNNNVSPIKTKVRLGNLSGITDTTFGTLNGYGLYSDNVYLKGTISAAAGTFSGILSAATGSIGGWTIASNSISSDQITLKSYIVGVQSASIAINNIGGYGQSGIYIGDEGKLSLTGPSSNWLYWDGKTLQISSKNFTLDKSGNIIANNAVLSGSISSSNGYIGGWSIL